MWNKLAFGLGLCSVLLLPLGTKTAQAQVGISPMVIEVKENGGQAQATINVVNNTKEAFRARVYAEPFTYDKENGFNTIPENPQSLVPYLKFSPRELNVPPGVTRRVRLNVQLPANLPEGEYRTAIFTENLDQQQQTNRQGVVTTVTTRIGVTMFVRKGDVAPKVEITTANWNAAKNQILLTMNNGGKASAYPEVNWTLKQGGNTVKTGKVTPTGIIASSQRSIAITIPQKDLKLQPGKYQLSGNLMWGEQSNPTSVPFNVEIAVK